VLAAFAQLIVGRLIDDRPLRSVFLPVAAFQAPLLLLAATLDGVPMLLVAFAMMFAIFGQIPINDAMVARCVDDEWRSRVFAVRYVVSFGASSLSVPLISYLHDHGGFSMAFVVLAAIALSTLGAALLFPRRLGGEAATSPSSTRRRPNPLPAGAPGSTGSD
jgi:predicted MFS family arabinose efflux permease